MLAYFILPCGVSGRRVEILLAIHPLSLSVSPSKKISQPQNNITFSGGHRNTSVLLVEEYYVSSISRMLHQSLRVCSVCVTRVHVYVVFDYLRFALANGSQEFCCAPNVLTSQQRSSSLMHITEQHTQV